MKAVDHDGSWSIYLEDPDANPYEITCYEYDALAPAMRERLART